MNPTLYPRQRRTRPGNVFYCIYQGVRLSCLDSEHVHQCSGTVLSICQLLRSDRKKAQQEKNTTRSF